MKTDFPDMLRSRFECAFTGDWFKKIIYQRLIVVLLILAQFTLFITISLWVSRISTALYTLMYIMSWVVVFIILASNKLEAYKLSWIIMVLAFPLLGGAVYAVLSTSLFSRKLKGNLRRSLALLAPLRRHRTPIHTLLAEYRKEQNSLATYVSSMAGYPLYKGGDAHYLPEGELMFTHMLAEIEKAESYVFLEFFIVSNDSLLQSLLEVLARKVKEGVEVLFLYDDMGSMFRLPNSFPELLADMGIQCRRFNHLVPVLSTQFNHRDHRKIVVIDGKVAFTGGINLADEYINKRERFGYWKDGGVVFTGEAAWGMSLMFLELWTATGTQPLPTKDDILHYCPDLRYLDSAEPLSDGESVGEDFIQPYGDDPFDDVFVGHMVYKKLIYNADRYLYITTPYLVLDDEMVHALCQAAGSGVDVRIITPHIWDKAYVRTVSRSYYKQFLAAGVQIFEYTPGFIHSKTLVTDDETAVIGTINFDYRSLYLHFEDAVVVYNQGCVGEVKADFLATQSQSQKITPENCEQSLPMRLFAQFLRLFSPLM